MDELQVVLLGLLQQGDRYGYQLRRTLEDAQIASWAAVSPASLEQELERIVREGLIERIGDVERPARTLYRITSQGRETLQRQLRQAWTDVEPLSTELARRWPLDIALWFIEALSAAELVHALRERLRRLEEELARLQQRIRERTTPIERRPAVAAIYDHARLRIQSEIDWTRAMIDRVEAGEYAPSAEVTVAAPPQRRPARTTEGLGAFTFVLHTHLPYVRMAGRWPHGEEWVHEAIAETYIPLLNALYDLREEGVDFKLTLSLTPVLTEQLADVDVRQHLMLYLEEEIEAAERDIPRFGEAGNAHLEYLADYYRQYYTWVRDTFLERFDRDLVGAFRTLQDEGYVEIITCAATHGYLPLLSRDASIYGQLRAGVETYKRHFGRAPRAIWLPECAYRPAYIDRDGTVRPALEEFLAALGLTCFFVETHAIEGGRPVGKAAGDVAIGPYTAIKRRYVVPIANGEAESKGTTFAAYYVVGNLKGLTDPPVAVIGRNNRTGQQVWSGDWGYPGDADYREFHKKDHQSGLQYWRITGPRVDLADKDYYHPDWAAHRVGEHARHFAGLVEELIQGYHAASHKYGIISSNYDTELFGHWWFEGVSWIKEVLRLLSASDTVDLTTASEYVSRHEPDQVIGLPESSWGMGGTHWTWDNPDTHWMWEPIHEAEQQMERLVSQYPEADDDQRVVLNQAARELLLLQSSDWPFLVTTGQAKEYATERFTTHLRRFQMLARMAESDMGPEARRYADELYELDNVFPDLDYRWFKERQGRAT